METLFNQADDQLDLLDSQDQETVPSTEKAIPLATSDPATAEISDGKAGRDEHYEDAPLPTHRALALSDVIAPSAKPGEALIRMAYRMGVPGHTLTAPFRRPKTLRILAEVNSPLAGDRAAGTALRAGHFLVNGVKLPIGKIDFDASARHSPSVERALHTFSWMRDLASSAPRSECLGTAHRVAGTWLKKNRPDPGKGTIWDVEYAGHRLINWLVHAPLIMEGEDRRTKAQLRAHLSKTARWLDRNLHKARDRLGEVVGWTAVTAAGLLLTDGAPRRLYGEAGLIRSLGELVAEDGGVLSRCPSAQLDVIALLTDLAACYEAVERDVPEALLVMRELLVPPLLTLRHGDGALGNWQGNGAIGADRVSAILEASGIRTRALKEVQNWGFQRLRGGSTIVQFDAAPPPRARHARCGCASTLAIELSDGADRLLVNCGGAALAGGLIPSRIAQGLRATAAHSTLVLDNANSTAVLLHGKLGKGVEVVEVDRRVLGKEFRDATRIDASHDGYAARFGLTHRRVLALRGDGSELVGQDVLLPVSRKGKRGKIGFAIRFHLGRGVETRLSEDRRGASLLLPSGAMWQFRLRGDADDAKLECEESLWVDSEGRPHPTEQLVIEGMTSRGGGDFTWLFRKMG